MKPPVDFVGQEMEIGFASKDSISHYMIFNFIEELNFSNSNFQFSFIIFHFQRKSEYSLMVSPIHTIHNPVIFPNSAISGGPLVLASPLHCSTIWLANPRHTYHQRRFSKCCPTMNLYQMPQLMWSENSLRCSDQRFTVFTSKSC